MVGGFRSPTLLNFKLLALFLGALAFGFLLGCALARLIATIVQTERRVKLAWTMLRCSQLKCVTNGYSLTGSHQLGQVCVKRMGRKSGLLGGNVLNLVGACECNTANLAHLLCVIGKGNLKITCTEPILYNIEKSGKKSSVGAL